jgi:hypothetical protein
MKTIALIVAALAIAFAVFRVSAYFEQRAVDECIEDAPLAIDKAHFERMRAYDKENTAWLEKFWKDPFGTAGVIPKPEAPIDIRAELKLKAVIDCERGRIFVLR